MGVLLGITGAIGSGKTTFASCLAAQEPNHAVYETYHLIAEVAQAFNQTLKAELMFQTGGNDIQLANQVLIWLPNALSESVKCHVAWDQLAITKHDILARPELYNKLFVYLDAVKHRPVLASQPITDTNKTVYRPLLQWIGGYMVAKISKTVWYDELCRRIREHDANKKLVVINGVRYPSDAEVVRLHGGHIIQIERSGFTNNNKDITEAQRSTIVADTVIRNNGPIETLVSVAQEVLQDVNRNKIKKRYSAL